MRDRMKQEPAAQKVSGTKDSKIGAEKVVSDDWTEEQTQLLIKAVNLFPAGTASRSLYFILFYYYYFFTYISKL